jgi:hypothetical protein
MQGGGHVVSLSGTAPTMPGSYGLKRRIGFIKRVGATIRTFKQTGDWFEFTSPLLAITTGALDVTSVSYNLGLATGFKWRVGLNAVVVHATTGVAVLVRDPDVLDQVPSSSSGALNNLKSQNTTGQAGSSSCL